MMISVSIQPVLPEAATAALASSCWNPFGDRKAQREDAQALARRCGG